MHRTTPTPLSPTSTPSPSRASRSRRLAAVVLAAGMTAESDPAVFAPFSYSAVLKLTVTDALPASTDETPSIMSAS